MNNKYKASVKAMWLFLRNFLQTESLKKIIVVFFKRNIIVKIIALMGSFFLFAYLKSSNIEEAIFSIPLKVNLPSRTTLTSDVLERVNVIYTGTKNSIASLDINSLYAEVIPNKIGKRHTVSVKVKGHLENIKVKKIDPENIRLTISKMQRKRLAVNPEFIDSPNKSFIQTSYKIRPQFIWVDGPKVIVKELTYLKTIPISLKGLTANKEIEVDISQTTHPKLVFNRDQKYIVKINIEKKREVLTSQKEYLIDAKNLDLLTDNNSLLNYFKDLSISNVQYVNYSALSSESIENDFNFYVDCSILTKNGNYQLPIIYERLTNIIIESYLPKSINISITNF